MIGGIGGGDVSSGAVVRSEGGLGCGDDRVTAGIDTSVELVGDCGVIENAIGVRTAVSREPDDVVQ